MPTPMMNSDDARDALAAVDRTRADLASLGLCPPWRHGAFGLVMGMVVLGQGVHAPWMWWLFGASLAGAVVIALHDRRKYGVFVNGYRRGRTRIVALGLVAAMFVAMALEVWLREIGEPLVLRLALAAVFGGVAIWFSVVWNRTFRREMLDHAA
ncbi:MAG: hypothetical protein ABIT16_02965 [Croceibacterium sp.]